MYSIIMPYYKNEHVVRRSIDSVINQKSKDYELIIVDDGSNDTIDSIVAEYNNAEIRVIHQVNSGVAHARNVGIQNSKGEWICFLDSDDEWIDNHLSVLGQLQDKYKGYDIFITSHIRLGANQVDSSKLLPESWDDDFVVGNLLDLVFSKGEVIHTNSICIRKDLFARYGIFEEGISIGEDTDLWFRFSMYSNPVMTKTVTTKYHRDSSFLTAHTKYSRDWPFSRRQEILHDPCIPIEKKDSMRLLLQRYELTTCKHMIANGEVREAREKYNSIEKDLSFKVNRQKKQLKFLFTLPPHIATTICNKIYDLRQKSY